MTSRFRVGKFLVSVAAAAAMLYAYRTAMSEAVHTVIASQPKPVALADPPPFDFSGCDLGLGLYGSTPSNPCRFDPPQAPMPPPIETMTKAQSETASLWFMLAALALPLGLGGAALAVYQAIKDR
jgi:hypothetical protein